MLKRISLQNFKCFEELDLPLGKINLLTGRNGMGKSTVIQGLLLLRQSYLQNKNLSSLRVNGKYVELGNGNDILFEKAKTDLISIGYEDEKQNSRFSFQCGGNLVTDDLPLVSQENSGFASSVFDDHFVYISAYRIRPQDVYSITNDRDLDCMEFGNNGEFAIQFLNKHGNDSILNSGILTDDERDTEKNSLQYQTKLWMDRISPGVSPVTSLQIQYRKAEVRYEFIQGEEKTASYKSVNVGFGITYVLPAVVALLAAKPGTLVIIENPEAHIHPAGQLALGELIARAGAGGVQVLVETHSDHILNGIRKMVKSGCVSPDDVILTYFDAKFENGILRHTQQNPKIEKNGRLSFRPDGFFDEWEKAMIDML